MSDTNTLVEDLLGEVRNYLDITWEDEAGDKKISGFIQRGMSYLNGIAGTELDYTKEAEPKALLLDYCRYARSHALEEYQENFSHELTSLHIMAEVKAFEETNTDI